MMSFRKFGSVCQRIVENIVDRAHGQMLIVGQLVPVVFPPCVELVPPPIDVTILFVALTPAFL